MSKLGTEDPGRDLPEHCFPAKEATKGLSAVRRTRCPEPSSSLDGRCLEKHLREPSIKGLSHK